jgi:hypothetical protein
MKNRKMTVDEIVLKHLQEIGNLTCMEAHTVYSIRSLSSAMSRLKKQGYEITSLPKKDLTGQRYVKYVYDRRQPRVPASLLVS